MTDLYHERRCELAFEFTDHLFDLKRWHRSSNSGIKALAETELNSIPRVRNYVDRTNPDSALLTDASDLKTDIEGVYYYSGESTTTKVTYQNYMMVFLYVTTKSKSWPTM